jgi:hypothetical protein
MQIRHLHSEFSVVEDHYFLEKGIYEKDFGNPSYKSHPRDFGHNKAFNLSSS